MTTHINFISINIAIVTISDTRTLDNDKSGDILEERVLKSNHKIISRDIVRDDFDEIKNLFSDLINNKKIDAVISTGGTGLKGRDITPEVMEKLFEKTIDGFGDMFRWLSYSKIGTSSLQS